MNRFSKKLLEQGIELISLLDINQKINIEENGKNAIENALIKAKKMLSKSRNTDYGNR